MLKIGSVVASYPQGNSVDVLLDEDGSRLSNVQVLTHSGSNNSGFIDLPYVDGPIDETRWNLGITRDRYVKAMVGFCRGVPFVAGFLLPQVNQITFDEKNRRIDRHASDLYTTIDDKANYELHHPSGTYIRIGTSASHEDLTSLDYDKKWSIDKNTASSVNLQITICNAGTQKASLNIDPSGNITLSHSGNLTVATTGSATVNVGGSVDLTAPQTTVHGPLTVLGLFTYAAGMAGSGGAGASAVIHGNVNVIGGEVTVDGIGVKGHHHSGVQTGGGDTSTSVA